MPDIDFSKKVVLEIGRIVREDSKLRAVKTMQDEFGIEHAKAKRVIAHFDEVYGQCHHCNFATLEGQSVTCPKCNSFNYNLKL